MGIGELVILVVIGTSIWVAVDANSRGLSGLGWGLGSLLLWIFVFPYYLVERQKVPALAVRTPGTPAGEWKPDPMAPDALERWHDGQAFTQRTRRKRAP